MVSVMYGNNTNQELLPCISGYCGTPNDDQMQVRAAAELIGILKNMATTHETVVIADECRVYPNDLPDDNWLKKFWCRAWSIPESCKVLVKAAYPTHCYFGPNTMTASSQVNAAKKSSLREYVRDFDSKNEELVAKMKKQLAANRARENIQKIWENTMYNTHGKEHTPLTPMRKGMVVEIAKFLEKKNGEEIMVMGTEAESRAIEAKLYHVEADTIQDYENLATLRDRVLLFNK